MKHSLLLVIALMLGMALTGCSKSESEEMEKTKETKDASYEYFEEPILDFSLTLEQIKAQETHVLTREGTWAPDADGPQDAAAPWLASYSYPCEHGVLTTTYYWADKRKGGICSVSVDWGGQKEAVGAWLHVQMVAHYGEPWLISDTDAVRYYSEKHNMFILETNTSITYYPLE